MNPNEYECASCHSVFEKGWSDDEAAADLAARFPGAEQKDCALVCDDCHQKIMAWAKEHPADAMTALIEGFAAGTNDGT